MSYAPKQKLDAEHKRIKDSLEKVKEKINQQLEKIDANAINNQPESLSSFRLQSYKTLLNID